MTAIKLGCIFGSTTTIGTPCSDGRMTQWMRLWARTDDGWRKMDEASRADLQPPTTTTSVMEGSKEMTSCN